MDRLRAIKFKILGEPVAKAEKQFTKTGHTYTPKKTRNALDYYRASVQTLLQTKYPGFVPWEGPVSVILRVLLPWPKTKQIFTQEQVQSGGSGTVQGEATYKKSKIINVFERKIHRGKKTPQQAEVELMQRLTPCTRPDIDNYQKLAFDSINGLIIRDDAQIVCVVVTKHYTLGAPLLDFEVQKISMNDAEGLIL